MAGDALDILRRYWNYEAFRPVQEEIIGEVTQGRDLLAMLPTGGGKSITFQVPAMMFDGLTLVITPLIALMKDQVESLAKRGIPAEAIYTGMERYEIMSIINKAAAGKLKLLYVSPERLNSERFMSYLKLLNVSLIAVDEAHCISQWGYDFRPSYLMISEVREILPNVPLLALTATATPDVADDIQDKLGFRAKNVLRGSFRRKNLSYVVRESNDRMGELYRVLHGVGGCAIVYVRRRATCSELAKFLMQKGIEALPYNAGMSMAERERNQDAWMRGEVPVIVATNAFGMGIDKPDVRAVVHYDIPDTLEAYFQEAGRAGRDGLRSYAVLLYGEPQLRTLKGRPAKQFPPIEKIRAIYDMLGEYLMVGEGEGEGSLYTFDEEHFRKLYKQSSEILSSTLLLLQGAGYIELTQSSGEFARVKILLSRRELREYDFKPLEESILEYFLRSLPGIFSHFSNFSEEEAASALGIDREKLYEVMLRLGRMKVLSYIPGSSHKAILYKQPRVPEYYVELPYEIYKGRMEVFAHKIEKMVEYITLSGECRQRFLCDYFGAEVEEPCGICDLCLEAKRKKRALSSVEKETLRLLKENGASDIRTLFTRVGAEKRVWIEAVRNLLDRGIIRYLSTSTLQIVDYSLIT